GVRRPGLLDVAPVGVPSRRGRHFLDAMAAHGIQAASISCEGRSSGSGAAGAHALLAGHPEVDAMAAVNDMLACGAIKAMHEAGLEIPSAVRVAGCDGLDLGRYVHPELTTLAVDMTDVAETAVGMAIDMHAGTLPLDGTRA